MCGRKTQLFFTASSGYLIRTTTMKNEYFETCWQWKTQNISNTILVTCVTLLDQSNYDLEDRRRKIKKIDNLVALYSAVLMLPECGLSLLGKSNSNTGKHFVNQLNIWPNFKHCYVQDKNWMMTKMTELYLKSIYVFGKVWSCLKENLIITKRIRLQGQRSPKNNFFLFNSNFFSHIKLSLP